MLLFYQQKSQQKVCHNEFPAFVRNDKTYKKI